MDVKKIWATCNAIPGGRSFFNCLLGWFIPYTGSIRAQVLQFESGRASVRLRDRRRVRNHLDSIHAVALMNLSELTTGLSVMSQLPTDARMILTHFEIDYLKKSRGTLISEANCPVISDNSERNMVISVSVYDSSRVEVCRAQSTWKIGPARKG